MLPTPDMPWETLSVSEPRGARRRAAEALVETCGFPLAAASAVSARTREPEMLRKRITNLAATHAYQVAHPDRAGRMFKLDYEVVQIEALLPLLLPMPRPFRFPYPHPIYGGDDWVAVEDGEGPTVRFRFASCQGAAGILRDARRRYLDGWKSLREQLRKGLYNYGDDLRLAAAEISFADGSESINCLVSLNGSARVHIAHEQLGISAEQALLAQRELRHLGALLGEVKVKLRAAESEERERLSRFLTVHADLAVGFDTRAARSLLDAARGSELTAHTDWQRRPD